MGMKLGASLSLTASASILALAWATAGVPYEPVFGTWVEGSGSSAVVRVWAEGELQSDPTAWLANNTTSDKYAENADGTLSLRYGEITNIASNSRDYSGFGGARVTLTESTELDYDGGLMTRVQYEAGTNTLNKSGYIFSGSTGVVSWYVRRGDFDYNINSRFGLYDIDTTTDLAYMTINYATLETAIGFGSAIDHGVVDVGGGLLRIWMKLAVVSGNSHNIYCGGVGGDAGTGFFHLGSHQAQDTRLSPQINCDGVPVTVPAELPFSDRGLLSEAAATNQFTSSDLNDFTVTGSGGTLVVTPGQPDSMGGTTAVRLQIDSTATSSFPRILGASTGVSTVDISTVGFRVKSYDGSPQKVGIYDTRAAIPTVDVGDTWTTITASNTSTSATVQPGLCLRNGITTVNVCDILVEPLAQLENAATLSSPIPTTNGPVTRAADDIYCTDVSWNTGGVFDAGLVILTEFSTDKLVATDRDIYTLSDSTSPGDVHLFRWHATNKTRTMGYDSSVPQFLQLGLAAMTAGTHRGATRIVDNDTGLWQDGAAEVVDNTCSMPISVLDQLVIGQNEAQTGAYFDGYVKELFFVPSSSFSAKSEIQEWTAQ